MQLPRVSRQATRPVTDADRPGPIRTRAIRFDTPTRAAALLVVAGLVVVGDSLGLATHQASGYGIAPVRSLGTLPAAQPAWTSPASTRTTAPSPGGPLPVALRIAPLGVDSAVQAVYTEPDGSLGVPGDVTTTGWWAGGARPGETGAAVIVGHVDSYRGPGVFVGIRRLKPGQEVDVVRSDGSGAVFRIDAIREYAKTDFPTKLVYGPAPDAQLRLVTCGGTFDRASRHYEDNVVAFAHLVRTTVGTPVGTTVGVAGPRPAATPTRRTPGPAATRVAASAPRPTASTVPGPRPRS